MHRSNITLFIHNIHKGLVVQRFLLAVVSLLFQSDTQSSATL